MSAHRPVEGDLGTLDELKQALVENLKHRGVLGKLKAQVRAEVFHTLEGPQDNVLHPPISNDNLLINELVRDYLSFNGYSHALSVFMAESGQPNDRALDRDFLRDELGLTERRETVADRKLPLLYGITHALTRWKEGCSKPERGDEESGYGALGSGFGPPRVFVRKEDNFMLNDYDTAGATAHGGSSNCARDPSPVVSPSTRGAMAPDCFAARRSRRMPSGTLRQTK